MNKNLADKHNKMSLEKQAKWIKDNTVDMSKERKTWQDTIEEQKQTILSLREAIYKYENLLDAHSTLSTTAGIKSFKDYIRATYDWRNR